MEKLPGHERDPVAACFPDRFTTFHWHGDTFSLPPGATSLFRSEGCAQQGFVWDAGRSNGAGLAVGLQFHPEITAAAITTWITESLAEGGGDLKPGPYVQAAADMDGNEENFRENNAWMAALCTHLINLSESS